MKKTIKSLLLSISALLFVVTASAQVTTSSLNGKVADSKGEAIPGAAVVAIHTPSGTSYFAVVNSEGRFAINGMRSGGPYSVEVSCLGYQTVTYTDITLQLAEAYGLSAELAEDSELLSEAIVVSTAASRFSAEKTGAATNISNSQITNLPTVSRSITDVTKLSPYGGNGMSFGGRDGRTANFTVDGANFNNNFGLSEALPGGGNPISLDAIEEMQVVISPYDVRQTNFIGGGVNAITKSGTNTFKGTAYVYHTNENLRGSAVDGEQISTARDKERSTTYGFTLGGPIIKNKLFFFASFEMTPNPKVVNRWRPSEDGVADTGNYISRTKKSDMDRVYNHLKTKYGYDAGSYTNYPAEDAETKLLARIDWNITEKHRLALRYNNTLSRQWFPTNGSSGNMKRRATESRIGQYGMAFSNSLYSQDYKANTLSLDLNSRFTDELSNQLLVTYSLLDQARGSTSAEFPFIDILDGEGITPYISAGYELFTWLNGVHNTVITAKNDLNYFTGSHKATFGVAYEYQMADNSYLRNGTGYYRYNSIDDFLNEAAPETVCLTYGYNGNMSPAARVRYHKLAAYAQDDWDVTDRFKLTAGLRLETIIFDNQDVMRNNKIYDVDYNGVRIDTGAWPTTKLQVSPRIGFTWDVIGDKSLKVRGGTGLFTGRLPLVFFTNMPTNGGMFQNVASISTDAKTGADPLLAEFAGPIITDKAALLDKLNSLDPERFPKEITPDGGVMPANIQAVDPKFNMPQVWKSSLAIDYRLPVSFPLSVTGEFIFNKTVYESCLKDYNIKPVNGFTRLNGADNRHIYPADKTYTETSAILLTNTSQGYGYNASFSINAEPIENLKISAAYTHNVSKELTGMPGSDASSAFTYIPTVEGPNNAPLHNSSYLTPDRAYASLSYYDKGNNSFSLFYEAWRGGSNYTYMINGDLNADNYAYDVIYIPTDEQLMDPSQMRFKTEDDRDRFGAYINKDPYLSSHKGQYAEAYSVYSPWVHRLDFRYAHDFKVKIGSSVNTLQLSVDVKNILNLFNSSWGVAKYMNPALQNGKILKLEKIDYDGVPVYSTTEKYNGTVPTWTYNHSIGQCWYAQVGLKYMFN